MPVSTRWNVTSFYRFFPVGEEVIVSLRRSVDEFMTDKGVTGLVIFATEGINGTVAGRGDSIAEFKAFLTDLVAVPDLRFKDSESEIAPFHRTSVVIRREIVGLKRPDLVPDSPDNGHLSPQEWHEFLKSDRPRVVIDTRNTYETRIGKFSEAVDPGLTTFSAWSDFVAAQEIPRETPVLIYCTGGIRCEKASLELREKGYSQVYQLQDGILGYLAEYPDGFFEGECYVFDDRIALDANLQPTTQYGMCPGCGLPGATKRDCQWCDEEYVVCDGCAGTWAPVCSKTCRDRFDRHGPRHAALANA